MEVARYHDGALFRQLSVCSLAGNSSGREPAVCREAINGVASGSRHPHSKPLPGECFWEVAPDLADSPAAAWALSGVPWKGHPEPPFQARSPKVRKHVTGHLLQGFPSGVEEPLRGVFGCARGGPVIFLAGRAVWPHNLAASSLFPLAASRA